ncbi:hypothetical protein SAMN05216328_12478 [Ensifer sp. YR511]|nr:hypothetical protein SAMN05216328_12478 [Ensifer sp. YR511]
MFSRGDAIAEGRYAWTIECKIDGGFDYRSITFSADSNMVHIRQNRLRMLA